MYHLTIIFIVITRSVCYSNYDIFQGFDTDQSNLETVDRTDIPETVDTSSTVKPISLPVTNQTTVSKILLSSKASSTTSMITTISTTGSTLKQKIKLKANCSEEKPTNIGSYEVPTEKDIVFFTKDLLLSMFEAYERDAMALLMDIKEVTKAAVTSENKCPYNKQAFKQCVKRVSGQSEGVTKSLVNSLQLEKMDVTALTDGAICSLSEMKSDPMTLVKLLAQETVMLKFALPGFLRLLNSCSELCSQYLSVNITLKLINWIPSHNLCKKTVTPHDRPRTRGKAFSNKQELH